MTKPTKPTRRPGRPSIDAVRTSISLSPAEMELFRKAGGSPWLRAQLKHWEQEQVDENKDSQPQEPDHP